MDKTKLKFFLNPSNKWITEDDIVDIFKKGGLLKKKKKLKPKNLQYYRNAFILSEMCLYNNKLLKNESTLQKYIDEYSEEELLELNKIDLNDLIPLQEECLESLEWYGDSVMKATSSKYIYERYPGKGEGFYSTTRSKLEKTITLSILALKLGYKEFMIVPRILEDTRNIREVSKELENVFEAFYGAMMMDFTEQFGYGKAMELLYLWLKNIYEKYLDIPEIVNKNNNFKDLLNKYYHKHFEGRTAKYEEDDIVECGTKRLFRCYVCDPDGNPVGFAQHSSKKEAQQMCAKQALIQYGLISKVKKQKRIKIKRIT